MLETLTHKTLVPLVLRAGLAVIFIFHGLQKVTGFTQEHVGAKKVYHWGTAWRTGEPELAVPMQAAVAYGELIGGVALAFGFLTRLAALGIGSIMVGAMCIETGRHGFYVRHGGMEYNLALLLICLVLVLMGPGILSMDRLLFPSRRKKPVEPTAAQPLPVGQLAPRSKSRSNKRKRD